MQIKIEEIAELNVVNFWAENNFTAEDSPILFTLENITNKYFPAEIIETSGAEYCLLCGSLISLKFTSDFSEYQKYYPLIMAEIDDFFASAEKTFIAPKKTELSALIEAVANSLIRPTLLRDKGNIEVAGIENNNLKIKFTGHCAGCPYAEKTLNNVITKVIKRHVPQIKNISLSEQK